MSYMDAAQLRLRLYITVDGVPEQLLPLSKDILSDAFAELACSGWVHDEGLLHSFYGAALHAVTDRGHWIEVMASSFKKRDVVDMPRGEALAQRAGFMHGKGQA
jgi:hypothetical protein